MEIDQVSHVESVSKLLDHCCDDIVERQFLNPIIFSDGWRHASKGVIVLVMRLLTFFLVTIESGLSNPNSLLYYWRMRILCFVPVTMASSLTNSTGRDRFIVYIGLGKCQSDFDFQQGCCSLTSLVPLLLLW